MASEPRPAPAPSRIGRDLAHVRDDPATLRRALDLGTPHRCVIFSDQHKGARDKADAFVQCEAAYRAALAHYRDRDFTLILLGDVEELWEQGFDEVQRHYADVLALEASFGPGRYIRIFGNHDDDWMDPALVRRRLAPYLPAPQVHEGLLLDVTHGGAALGTILLVHGHQGTVFSHKLRAVSRIMLRIWRPLQRLFGFQLRQPSEDPCLRSEHDREMYAWAATQPRLILVAGHTHRPVWSSRTHLQKLEAELAGLLGPAGAGAPATERIQDLEARIAALRERVPPCGDSEKTLPAYFNTGCCIFDDGDITGLELENGILRLVKWPVGGTEPRVVLEEDHLTAILARLSSG